jgi:hypothetical protein
MSRAVFHRMLVSGVTPGVALVLLTLSACSSGLFGGRTSSDAVGPSGVAASGQTDLPTQQACRRRVNEMYDIRDRGEIYAANPSANTPFSANYLAGVPNRGLSNQFAYEQTLAECERNARSDAQSVQTPLPPAPAAKGR